MTELLPVTPGPHQLKLSARDFDLLERNGAFVNYAKTELIDGSLYCMNSQHRPHARIKIELYDALRESLRRLGSPLRPLVEVGVALSDLSTPEPDLIVTSEPRGEGWVPLPSVSLVVEVSDTTLAMDLGRKLAIYAQAGVQEYWVADVNARVIHQMWAPESDGYTARRETTFGMPLSSATLDGLTIDTQGL